LHIRSLFLSLLITAMRLYPFIASFLLSVKNNTIIEERLFLCGKAA